VREKYPKSKLIDSDQFDNDTIAHGATYLPGLPMDGTEIEGAKLDGFQRNLPIIRKKNYPDIPDSLASRTPTWNKQMETRAKEYPTSTDPYVDPEKFYQTQTEMARARRALGGDSDYADLDHSSVKVWGLDGSDQPYVREPKEYESNTLRLLRYQREQKYGKPIQTKGNSIMASDIPRIVDEVMRAQRAALDRRAKLKENLPAIPNPYKNSA
jgi:hypothetical protein